MVAAVAAVDPQMAAKPLQAIIVATASPPGILPASLWADAYMRPLIPDAKANDPISTNSTITFKG